MCADNDVPPEVRSDPLLANCFLANCLLANCLLADVSAGRFSISCQSESAPSGRPWYWLPYQQPSANAVDGRSLKDGAIYNRTGARICTVTQKAIREG